MKKLFYGLLAYCMPLTVPAQTVSVADVEALPGETVNIAVSLSEGKANTYTAFSFDLQFPVSGFTTTGDYTIANAWKGVSAVIGDVDETGHATVALASANEIAEATVEGLVTVSVKVDESVPTGSYEVTLSNILLEYGLSEKDYPADATFTFHVVTAHTLVLDENSNGMPEAAEGVNVKVKRTIKANQWSTICLPFAMTEEQLKTAFGDDVKLADFKGCEATYADNGETVLALNVNFEHVSALEANHPYIIKVAQNMSEFRVDGVDVDPEEEPSVDRDEYRTGSGTKKDPYVYHYNSFVGVYVADTEIPEYTLFLSDNKFWYSMGLSKSKAFRGYFDFYDVLSEVENAETRIRMSFDDEEISTAIVTERKNAVRSQSYDLQGRRVEKARGKGIYITSGKKLVVK